MEISGASVLVTGAASGLGLATARALAERGAQVVLVDRQADAGKAAADEIGGQFVPADITDADAVGEAIAAATALGPLRGLVNCAGIGRNGRTVNRSGEPFDLRTFELVLRVNLVGTFNCVRLAAAAMAAVDPDEDGARGAIVNTASVAAYDGQIGQAAYSASKGGIVGMTLPIARDLATLGIRVNTIAPGLFDTPIYGSGGAAEAFKAELGKSVVFPRRLGRAEEFARMAVELLTNGYVNGEVVRLDGALRLPPR